MYIHEKLEMTSIEDEQTKIVGALHKEQWLHQRGVVKFKLKELKRKWVKCFKKHEAAGSKIRYGSREKQRREREREWIKLFPTLSKTEAHLNLRHHITNYY